METTIEEKINKMIQARLQELKSKMGYNERVDTEYFATDCAIEQDRIARKEERKKCINAFCKIECGRLANETCPNTDSCILECKKYKSFCKAIVEGGEQL